MTYKIYDENLPHDRYEVAKVLQNSDGTKIVLEGLSHIVTLNFGFVEALCLCDEGRRIESYHQIPEIQAYRKADFEGNPLYLAEGSDFMNWLMKESCGFAFDDLHFAIITENDFLDIAAPFPPKIELRPKTADGRSFLKNTSFHDAKLVDVRYGEKYGKERLSLFVDFKTAERPPKDGNFYEISFSDGKFVQEPKRMKDCYILALDCFFAEQFMRVRMELEYFVGGEAHHDVLEIGFSDVKVFK